MCLTRRSFGPCFILDPSMFSGEPQEDCYKCGSSYLTASNQIINGYCRSCLARSAPGRPVTSPGDRATNYSIESLSKSSFTTKSPPEASIAMSPSRHLDPRFDRHIIDSPQSLAMSGYAMLNAAHSHNMGMPALPVPVPHPASGLLHYPGSLSWNKLVPQHYWHSPISWYMCVQLKLSCTSGTLT